MGHDVAQLCIVRTDVCDVDLHETGAARRHCRRTPAWILRVRAQVYEPRSQVITRVLHRLTSGLAPVFRPGWPRSIDWTRARPATRRARSRRCDRPALPCLARPRRVHTGRGRSGPWRRRRAHRRRRVGRQRRCRGLSDGRRPLGRRDGDDDGEAGRRHQPSLAQLGPKRRARPVAPEAPAGARVRVAATATPYDDSSSHTSVDRRRAALRAIGRTTVSALPPGSVRVDIGPQTLTLAASAALPRLLSERRREYRIGDARRRWGAVRAAGPAAVLAPTPR